MAKNMNSFVSYNRRSLTSKLPALIVSTSVKLNTILAANNNRLFIKIHHNNFIHSH